VVLIKVLVDTHATGCKTQQLNIYFRLTSEVQDFSLCPVEVTDICPICSAVNLVSALVKMNVHPVAVSEESSAGIAD
jgi:hypothetical protein